MSKQEMMDKRVDRERSDKLGLKIKTAVVKSSSATTPNENGLHNK